MDTRKIVCLGVVFLIFFGVPCLEAHYRSEQYEEAEKGLDALLLDLSTHLNALEKAAGQLGTSMADVQDPFRRYAAMAAMEILEHHAMRAWYNRLLFQNLSDEAVSLGQMSTIVNLSIKSLSPAVYKMEKIKKEENSEVQKRIYKQATETMRSLLALYQGALGHLKAIIRTGR